MPKHDYSGRKYLVVPYDPEWPIAYENIHDELKPVFGGLTERIEHIGSTAIPGMAGKPTIDILVVANDMAAVDALNDKLAALGYEALGEYVAPGGRLFALEKDGLRLVNVHCFPPDHRKTESLLAMRDYLRAHPEESEAYAQLKLDLYEEFPNDYGAYLKQKDVYLKDLESRAADWSTQKA